MTKSDNSPFKISVEHWDRKLTVEMDHSDIKWNDYVDLLRDLSRAVGWRDEDINELFGS